MFCGAICVLATELLWIRVGFVQLNPIQTSANKVKVDDKATNSSIPLSEIC